MPGQDAGKIIFFCQSCGQRIAAPPSASGKRVRCPGCEGVTAVPDQAAAEAAEAPRAAAPRPARLSRTCPQCGKVLRLKARYAGKAVRCPGCRATVPPNAAELVDQVEYSEGKRSALGTALGWGISALAHAVLLLLFTAITWLEEAPPGKEPANVAVVLDEERRVEKAKVEPLEIKAPTATLTSFHVDTPTPENLDPIPRLGTKMDATKNEPLIGIDVGIGSGAGATSGHWRGLMDGKGGVGTGSANFFGLKARGRKFVYVVDHSASMSGPKLAAAKAELLRSMRALQHGMQFYVIFYNTGAEPMPRKAPVKATKDNLSAAAEWVAGIRAVGETDPTKAMKLALSFKPDAVWLLTDGIFSPRAADAIRDANPAARVQIHTIAFYDRITERQLRKSSEPLLRKIAQENRGGYRFVRSGS